MTITMTQTNLQVPPKKIRGTLSGTYTAASVTNALLTTVNAEVNGPPVTNSSGTVTYPKQSVVLAAGVLTINLGFAPRHVIVQNVTQRISKEWYDGMNLTDSLLVVAAGTATLVTTSGVLIVNGTSGTAPVTYEPASSVTITFATDSLVTDNDTIVWEIEG